MLCLYSTYVAKKYKSPNQLSVIFSCKENGNNLTEYILLNTTKKCKCTH